MLVLPYRQEGPDIQFAVFRRADAGYWQFVAGGGEGNEAPMEAARREAGEEAAISSTAQFFMLESRNTVPVLEVTGSLCWGPDVLVIPEYTFGVEVTGGGELRISREHTEFRWADYDTCRAMLHWHCNRNALHELNHRIFHCMIPGSQWTS